MADDAALIRGIIVILRDCLGLSQSTKDAELTTDVAALVARIKARESDVALVQQVGAVQLRLGEAVDDSACKEVVKLTRKLVDENSN